MHLGINYDDLATAQEKDPKTLIVHLSLVHREVIFSDNCILLWDLSTSYPCSLIPKSFCYKVFGLIHGLHHQAYNTKVRLECCKERRPPLSLILHHLPDKDN